MEHEASIRRQVRVSGPFWLDTLSESSDLPQSRYTPWGAPLIYLEWSAINCIYLLHTAFWAEAWRILNSMVRIEYFGETNGEPIRGNCGSR